MRIADKMAYNQTTSNLQKNRSEMSELQNQAATQKRINKPSDDPTASARVLAARTEQRGSEQFVKNINIARSFLEFSDQSLGELSETLMRVKELAISQANDAGASEETRKVTASEIEQAYNQTVQVGNRKLGERFIFGGYKTTNTPFDVSGEYKGDDGDMKIQINKDAFVAMNISGDKVFLGKGISEDGQIRTSPNVPKNTKELQQYKVDEHMRVQKNEEANQQPMGLRSPASVPRPDGGKAFVSREEAVATGVNILKVLKDFEIALRVNDKEGIQVAIDEVDSALSQVVNARAQVGSRIMALNAAQDSLQKAIVDNKTTASQLEDVDLFQVVSDINKTDSTLKATLETSSKVTNMSLLDFLR